MVRKVVVLAAVTAIVGCAGVLNQILQPPNFSQAAGRQAELRLVGPSSQSPLGGAGIRVWARVQNPNSFGLSLTQLAGSLALEGTRAANFDFPLGVPLQANQDTVIPLDITVRFSDLPGLADLATRLLTRSSVAYSLDGSVTLDAGMIAKDAKFGPMNLLTGNLVIRR
jgi:hypothetical protein